MRSVCYNSDGRLNLAGLSLGFGGKWVSTLIHFRSVFVRFYLDVGVADNLNRRESCWIRVQTSTQSHGALLIEAICDVPALSACLPLLQCTCYSI